MAKDQITLDADTITGRGNTLNPFIILEGAAGFITFAEEVFDAREVAEARTPTPTGKLIHAELRVGDSLCCLPTRRKAGGRTPACFRSGPPTSRRCCVAPSIEDP
jgi:hypothetical protein